MTSKMDISFIDRTLKTTGVLSFIVLSFGWMYFPIFDVLSVFSGMIWGIINLYFLSRLIVCTIRPEGPDKGTAAAFFFIKLPILYLAGYFLIKVNEFDILLLVAGFTSLFAVMLLKVLSRALLGLDDQKPVLDSNQQEAL